jgi:hypothetical protein
MKRAPFLCLTIALTIGLATVRGTTVIPPTFDQLVGQAEMIFQGSVTDVRSQWVGEGNTRHIESYVTFKVEDSLKGSAGDTYIIRMYGGTVGEDAMGISDGPVFHAGDREILFVEHNGEQVVPLVGIMFGRFHVQRDQASGLDTVTGAEGEPVKSVASLGHQMEGVSTMDAFNPAMTADAFKAEIRNKLQSTQ